MICGMIRQGDCWDNAPGRASFTPSRPNWCTTGITLFSNGACSNIAAPFGLENIQVKELVRVALAAHQTPTSRIVSIAVRLFHRDFPAVKVLVSYADSAQGHHGGIYQAMGWLYIGESTDTYIRINGKTTHRRTLGTKYGTSSLEWIKANVDANAERIKTKPKYKYLWFFDEELKDQWRAKALPYPMRNKC